MSLYWIFVIALAGYTFAILRHRILGFTDNLMIWTFGVALVADTSGTIFLCAREAASFSWSVHTISGILALVIMALHFLWALKAQRDPKTDQYFHRYSLWAWGLWLVAFVTPIIPHMI